MAAVVHISDEEAARDLDALLTAVRSGSQVMIEAPGRQGVMMMIPEEPVRARDIATILEGREASEESSIFDDPLCADVPPEHEGRKVPQTERTFERRTIAEAIEILRLREVAQGLAVPDPDMAADMEDIHALYNQPMDMSRWE